MKVTCHQVCCEVELINEKNNPEYFALQYAIHFQFFSAGFHL